MKDHLVEIDPIAYSAATEKLDKLTKKKMNEQRRRVRKNSINK
jgi:hypothetical protein